MKYFKDATGQSLYIYTAPTTHTMIESKTFLKKNKIYPLSKTHINLSLPEHLLKSTVTADQDIS